MTLPALTEKEFMAQVVEVARALGWREGAVSSGGPSDATERDMTTLETMECPSNVIATFLRSWNDSLPTDEDRQRLLRPLLPLVVGTIGDNATELRRSYMALDWLVRVHTPAWLLLVGLDDHAEALIALDEITGPATMEKALPAVSTAWTWGAAGDTVRDAVGDAVRDAAGAAVRAAAWDAARAAAWDAARIAAWDAARIAAWNAALYAARTAAWDAAGDAARIAAWAGAWAAVRAAAGDAARAAAWDALLPTVAELQVSAQDLVRRMAVAK